MCDNAVDNYTHALGSPPDCIRPKKMCDKDVNTYSSTICS